MTPNVTNWETLNAYVDGELDAAAAARVAAAAAGDGSLAARIATLSALKANVARPDRMPAAPAFRPPLHRSRWRASRFAAVAAAMLVLAAVAVLSLTPRSPQPSDWLTDALSAQQKWIASAATTDSQSQDSVAISASTAMRPLDLSEAHLKLVYAVPVMPTTDAPATFLGYRGPHGCMVGLWIGSPHDGLDTTLAKRDSGNIAVRAWSNPAHGYALMAGGIDPARIDRLAEVVARLVDPGQIIDDSLKIALRDAARIGPACRT